MADINVKGTTAKPDALSASTPGAGDIVSKLQRYLTGDRRLSQKKAAGLLADAIGDFLDDAASSTEELDEADRLIEQMRNAGIQGKSPEEISESLAGLIEAGSRRGNVEHLETFLRSRVDARLSENDAGA